MYQTPGVSERKFDRMSPELRADILQFYSDLTVPIETKKDSRHWHGVLAALDGLKSAAPVLTVAGLASDSPAFLGSHRPYQSVSSRKSTPIP